MLLSLRRSKFGNLETDQKRDLKIFDISRFERMKTVFAHALIDDGTVTPVYNVAFCREGRLIISGADDGAVKIFDRDTMSLQASLHGHTDVITDLDVSKCNKYIASASKDGAVNIWDL